MDTTDTLILNSINAKVLKSYLCQRMCDIVDELVVKKTVTKKKLQNKKPEMRIPVDLLKEEFVSKFGLGDYKDGVLTSLIISLIENNYFNYGKLKYDCCTELVLSDIERDILSKISHESPLNIDVGDVKILANRLRTVATSFTFRGVVYQLEHGKTEDIINQLIKNCAICLDTKNSIKDSFYTISDELLDVLRTRLFRCPQVKDNIISRTRLYDYFTRMTKPDESKIYVILKDSNLAQLLEVDTVTVDKFIYTKHSLLVAAVSAHVDKYSKRFSDEFYEKISEYVKDNEKINVSKVIDYITVPTIKLDKE